MPPGAKQDEYLAKRRPQCHDLLVVRKYKSGSSTKHRLMVHLVWCPKYRRRILLGEVAKRLYELFKQAAEVNDWQIHEMNIQRDHVHMLIQYNPRESISSVVHLIKGGSSRVLRQEFPDLEEFLWGDSFWSDGYFAESVGAVHEDMIKDYIKNQNKS